MGDKNLVEVQWNATNATSKALGIKSEFVLFSLEKKAERGDRTELPQKRRLPVLCHLPPKQGTVSLKHEQFNLNIQTRLWMQD